MATDKDRWFTALQVAACEGKIHWKQHALTRVLEREISVASVEKALCNGEMIEFYPDAHPLPACLVLHENGRPLHVVVAFQAQRGVCYIITVYHPDNDRFESDWKTRKPND